LKVILDRLPFGGGPALVKDLQIIDPVVQIAKSPAKIIDLQSLSGGSSSEEEDATRKKPSQVVRIGHLKIVNARILLQDSSPRRNTWAPIQLNVEATGATPSDYKFKITESGPIARLDATGAVNVDHRILSLDQFALAADFNAPAPPADPLEQIVQRYRLRGSLAVDGSLYIDSHHSAKNRAWAAVTAKDVSGLLPGTNIAIDSFQLNSVTSVDTKGLLTTLSKFVVHSGNFSLAFDGGSIKTTPNSIDILGLTGQYGNDQFSLSANWPLVSAEHGIARLDDIDGRIDFHSPTPLYPDPLDAIFAQFKPTGPWRVQGWIVGEIATGKVLNYDFHVESDGTAAADITARDIQLSQIKSTWEILPDHVAIADFSCTGLGGKLDAAGQVQCFRPFPFDGQVNSQGADLSQIAALLRAQSLDKSQFQGQVDVSATFAGSGPHQGKDAADLFTADGNFEIHNGVLWDIPVLKRVADSATIARKALNMSEAAAYFHIADQNVDLRDAAINAPVLGLQGSGTVDFDGNIDMKVQAAPLADWQAKIDKTGIPIVSNVVGDVVGAVQSLLNSTTGALFYTFHITGNASDPQVTTVPAPAITFGTARLFGYMVKKYHGSLLNLLQNPSSQPTTQPSTHP
jgi:hypothetical protein